MKKSNCNHCICKTCAIAYENSGAEGCGDCTKCKEEKWDTVNNCPMYYNPTKKFSSADSSFCDGVLSHVDDDIDE